MTDFFSDLEGHLHRAARRRAARNRAVPAVTLAMALALAVVAVAALGRGGDPEVAVPAPTPEPPAAMRVDCTDDAVPAALLNQFEVLRSREPVRSMPSDVVQALKSAEDVARVWTDARHVGGAEAEYWIVPVAMGAPCGEGDPTRTVGACVVFVHRGAAIPSCRPLGAIRSGEVRFHGRTDDGRGFVAALVPDGFTFHVEVGGRRENGMAASNIGEKAIVATPEETRAATVYFEPLPEPAPEGCFTVTDAEPDPRIADVLPMFAKVPRSRYGPAGGEWQIGGIEAAGEGATGVHAKYTRRVGEGGGWVFSAAPVQQVGCEPPARGPGACVLAGSGDGAAAQFRAWCWTAAEIEKGQAQGEVEVGPGKKLGFELRGSEFAAFCRDNPGACKNLAEGGTTAAGSFVLTDP